MKFQSYNEFNDAKKICRECSIGNVYNKVVLSDGNIIDPMVLIVGEAAGADELISGFPFVGKTGKLLRSTLNEFGFRKFNTLISNVIPCRPENNKFPQDFQLIQKCFNKWLYNEIILTEPSYMLLIGGKPLKYILSLDGITRKRGEWYDFNINNKTIKCMPTFHPSYIKRKEYMEEGKLIKEQFREDIKQVAQKAGFIR